jgi:hypothetical protein
MDECSHGLDGLWWIVGLALLFVVVWAAARADR